MVFVSVHCMDGGFLPIRKQHFLSFVQSYSSIRVPVSDQAPRKECVTVNYFLISQQNLCYGYSKELSE